MRRSLLTDFLLSMGIFAVMLASSAADGKLVFDAGFLGSRQFHGALIGGGVSFVGLALLSIIARLLTRKAPPSG